MLVAADAKLLIQTEQQKQPDYRISLSALSIEKLLSGRCSSFLERFPYEFGKHIACG